RTAAACLAVLGAGLVLAPAARAGTYNVTSCQAPGRRDQPLPHRSGGRSAQERRDVELVVADDQRVALTLVDPRAAVARRAGALLARGAQPAVVEAGGDH